MDRLSIDPMPCNVYYKGKKIETHQQAKETGIHGIIITRVISLNL